MADDRRVYFDVFLPPKSVKKEYLNKKVFVRVEGWNDNFKNPVGRVIDVVGEIDSLNTEMNSILYDYGFAPKFPSKVEESANKIDDAISNKIYDSVWINTPSFLHYQNVIDVSNATSNIIVAKPLTNNFQTAYDLVRHAEYKKINLVVGHQSSQNC